MRTNCTKYLTDREILAHLVKTYDLSYRAVGEFCNVPSYTVKQSVSKYMQIEYQNVEKIAYLDQLETEKLLEIIADRQLQGKVAEQHNILIAKNQEDISIFIYKQNQVYKLGQIPTEVKQALEEKGYYKYEICDLERIRDIEKFIADKSLKSPKQLQQFRSRLEYGKEKSSTQFSTLRSYISYLGYNHDTILQLSRALPDTDKKLDSITVKTLCSQFVNF